jgi:glycosyltransferase involved in cell wall biosynthesis
VDELMTPLVSILIPCFNAECWITQCIESALAQTWPEKEVIVVDDGSTDHSLDIIQSFGDRIRWKTGPNHGANAARNRLLELSRGEWLQYLDADDYLLPGKILSQLRCLENSQDSDVLYSPILLQFGSEEAAPKPNPNPLNSEDMWIALVRWHTPQTGGFLYKRRALLESGGWNLSQTCCQDNELTMRLLMHGKRFFFCRDAGAVYRLWSEQTVSNRDRAKVRKRRLEILEESENFLRERGQLTEPRLRAINQARFEIARVTWPHEPGVATEIVDTIVQSYPAFQPGAPIPLSYRACYRVLGFQKAERIAAWRRRITQRQRGDTPSRK